jgi:uncharacterized repeat protein (TIGR01451 family)
MVDTGTVTTLSWKVTNAASCSAEGDAWSGERLPEDGMEPRYVYEDTVYRLTCSDGDASASDSVNVDIDPASSQLLVSIDMDLYLVQANDPLNVDVTVSNPASTTVVENVIINILIPQYVIIAPGSLPDGATCTGDGTCAAGEFVEIPVGDLMPGQTTQQRVSSTVSSTVPVDEEISFEATVDADDQPPAIAEEAAAEGESDLVLALAQTPTTPTAGDIILYTLHYENSGTDPLPNVELLLTLPGPVAVQSTSGSPELRDGVLVWDVGTLSPMSSGSVDATVEVDPDLPDGAQLRSAAGARVDGAVVKARSSVTSSVSDDPGEECMFDDDCDPGNVCDNGRCVPPLVASIVVNPDPVKAGELLYATISVSNPTSSRTADDVRIDLPLPNGLNLVNQRQRPGSSCTSVNCGSGQTVSWNIPSLGPGGSTTQWITPVVANSAADGLEMAFPISVTHAGGTPVADEAVVTVDTERTLGLRIVESKNPVRAGETVEYTIHFANQGNQTVGSLEVTGLIPVGTSLVSASEAPTVVGEAVSWTVGPLAPGEGGVRRMTVAVPVTQDSGSQLTATATATAGQDTSTSVAQTQVASTPLLTSVAINRDPLEPNELFNVAVTVSNPSPNTTANDVTVALQLPQGINLVNAAQRTPDSTCSSVNCGASQVVRWTRSAIAPGESFVFMVEPSVASGALDGDLLVFRAEAFASGETPSRANATSLVQSDRWLVVRAVPSANPVTGGQNLSYTLYFSNEGTQTLASVDLHATIPLGTTFVGASDDGTEGDGVVDWTVGPLAPGRSSTRRFTVAVPQSQTLGSQLKSEVEATIDGEDADRARTNTAVQVADTPLIAFLEVTPDPTRASELANVALTVSNPSTGTIANDVRVDIRLPQGIGNINGPQRSPDSSCSSVNCGPSQVVTWNLGTLDPGDSTVLLLDPLVSGGVDDGLIVDFDAQVYSSGNAPVLASGATLVQGNRPIRIHTVESADPVRPGDPLRYTIYVSNQDTQTIDSVDVFATIPEGASFTNASDGGTEDSAVVQWQIGPLGPGEGTSRQFTTLVDDSLPPGSQLRSYVQGIVAGSDADRARSVTQTQVATGKLIAAIEVNPDPTAQNELFNVSVTVSNPTAFEVADDVEINVRLPQFLSLVGASRRSAGASCSSVNCGASQVITWGFESLAAGESVVVSLEPIVASGVANGTIIDFDAQIYGVEEVPIRTGGATIVNTDRTLLVRSIESRNPSEPSESLTYELYFANQGEQTISTFDLAVAVPELSSFVSASNGATASNGTVDWTVGPLSPDQTGVRTMTVSVDPMTAGSQLRSEAHAEVGSSDTERARASTQSPIGTRLLTSTASGPGGAVVPGDRPTVSVLVENPSTTATVNDIQIDLQLPLGIALIAQAQRPGSTCSSVNCGPGQTVSWTIAELAPGASTEVSIQPDISNGTEGSLLLFDSETTVTGVPVTVSSTIVRVEAAP